MLYKFETSFCKFVLKRKCDKNLFFCINSKSFVLDEVSILIIVNKSHAF